MGKASGQPIAGQTGLTSAAPLLFSVFEKLPRLSRSTMAARDQSWKNPAPDGLKYFTMNPTAQNQPVAGGLDIEFPADDTTFLLADMATRGMVLRARAGMRPLVWMINGVPLATDRWKRSAIWTPTEPGFYDITVLDKNAVARHRHITIRKTAPQQGIVKQASLISDQNGQ